MVAAVFVYWLILLMLNMGVNTTNVTTTAAPHTSKQLDCSPYLSEISMLYFNGGSDVQIIELAVPPKCVNDTRAMKQLPLSDYGLLILSTKSKEVHRTDIMETKTYIRFSKQLWPKKDQGQAGKRGGKRIRDNFFGFFVVGGPPEKIPSVPVNSTNAEIALHWNVWEDGEGKMCGSLMNWPHCHPYNLKGQLQLDRFVVKQSASTPTWIENTEQMLAGQIVFIIVKLDRSRRTNNVTDNAYFNQHFSYIQADRHHNRIEVEESAYVTLEEQLWLSERATDIVVLTPSLDSSVTLPLNRVQRLFERNSLPITAHVYPALAEVLPVGKSISRCSKNGNEHMFAVTTQTIGYTNFCETPTAEFLTLYNYQELCPITSSADTLEDTITFSSTETFNSPVDENYDMPMEVSEFVNPPLVERDEPVFEPLEQAHSCHAVPKRVFVEKTENIMLSQKVISSNIKAIRDQQCAISTSLRKIADHLKDEQEFKKTVERASQIQIDISFGIHRDEQEHRNMLYSLMEANLDGRHFTKTEITSLMRHKWLSFYEHQGDTTKGFFRCKMCNRHDYSRYSPQRDAHKCNRPAMNISQGGQGYSLLGQGRILCLNHYSLYSENPLHDLTRAVRRHATSKEHMDHFTLYKQTMPAKEKMSDYAALSATITSTLAAYTLAKQGVPLSSQFHLLLFALRTGANVGTAHFEATSARRMIKNFAVHMEYDLWNWMIDENLPFSLLVDGTASQRGQKWMIYLVRTLTPSNRPHTFHLLFEEVRRETGSVIKDAFISHLSKRSIWKESPGLRSTPLQYTMEKMVALVSDGAAVMTGKSEGLYGQLLRTITAGTNRNALLLAICDAHRLNLAMKDITHDSYRLARALIIEMHAVFGHNVAASPRRIYKDVARLMGFVPLHMAAFFPIRWTDSFRTGLRSILRMYPVLLEALAKVHTSQDIAHSTRNRARLAEWVMKDGRVFITMKHVLALLDRLAAISLKLQQTDSLYVDAAEATRKLLVQLTSLELLNDAQSDLIRTSPLRIFDGKRIKPLDANFIDAYFTNSFSVEQQDEFSGRWKLIYLPTKWPGYKQPHSATLTPEERPLSQELLLHKYFRPMEPHSQRSEAEHLRRIDIPVGEENQDAVFDFLDAENVRGTSLLSIHRSLFANTSSLQNLMADLYRDIRGRLFQRFSEATELPDNFFAAVDRHLLLDMIDFEGLSYNDFLNHIPVGATYSNRGYPFYINGDTNRYSTIERNRIVEESITLIEKYCSISGLRSNFHHFYSNLHINVERIRTWPRDFRHDDSSLRLYQTILNNARSLAMSKEVKQAFQCVMVIPASNGDSERSFSTANRLTAGTRSRFSQHTLNALFHIQRNGPSLLTVDASKLANMWINPKEGLNLHRGVLSTKAGSDGVMAEIKEAYCEDLLSDANGIKDVMETNMKINTLLQVFADREIHSDGEDEEHDKQLRENIISDEMSKLQIFSLGPEGIY